MANSAVALSPANGARTRAMWLPREHGAWGMLLIPLISGAAVTAGEGGYGSLALFTFAALSLFWLRTPVESLLGTSVVRARSAEERRAAAVAIGILLLISLLSLSALFWGFQHADLLWIGAISGLAFGVQALVKRNRKFRALAQVVGAIGLTSTAASAYYMVTGELNSTAFALWGINWMFAAEQIEFVQFRIHGARLATVADRLRRGKSYLSATTVILVSVALLGIFELVPALAILAFLPAVVRAAIWMKSKPTALDVHKLGWMELANSAVFAGLLVVVFRTFA